MTRRAPFSAGALTVIAFVGAMGAYNNPPTGPGSLNTSLRLELTGPTTVAPGQLAEYRLVAVSAGGSPRDVSLEAEWRSSTEGVISIASPGRAAAQQPGEAVITASYQGRLATIALFDVPEGTFALRGTVKDRLTDLAVADARVYVLSGTAVVLETTTGTDGRYQLYGVHGSSDLRVSREGYVDDHRPLEIRGHTTLDLFIRRLGVPDTYTGAYTLTLEIGGQCSSIPDADKTRTYTATIEVFDDPRLTADYVVTLSDATFASGCGTNALAPGLGCNQFFAHSHGASLSFSMSDYDWGGWAVDNRMGCLWRQQQAGRADRAWPAGESWTPTATSRFRARL